MRGYQVLLLLALIWVPLSVFRPPTRQQELRVLLTARTMVERGDWMHFEFQRQPRYRKPPMPYWLAATGYLLTGQTGKAWAGRLPFLLVSLLGVWAFQSLTRDTSPKASLPLLLSAGFIWYGCLAETDMPQIAGMIFAIWGWKKSHGLSAGAGMAFAFLCKGPAGIAIPLLTMAIASRKNRRSWGFWIPAILLPLCAVGFWVGFLQLDPIAREALSKELTATFHQTEHRNPVPYYLYTLPLMMLPGACWLIRKKDGCSPALAWIWLSVGFVLLTLTISKQQHYTLMLIPPAAWILSSRMTVPNTWNPFSFRLLAIGTFLLSLIVGLLVDRVSTDGQHHRFLSHVQRQIAPTGTLHVVGINSARFDLELGRHVDNVDSAKTALNRAGSGESVIIVQKRKYWDAEQFPQEATYSDDNATWIRRLYEKPSSE